MKGHLLFSPFFYLLLSVGFTSLVAQAGAQAPPNPPSGLTIFDRSHISFQVRWNAPATGGGAPITGYDVRYRIAPSRVEDFHVWPHTIHTTDTTVELDGLNSNTTYEVQVSAINADGNSDWSDSGFTHTLGTLPPLTMPSQLTASGITGTSFRVSWLPPYTVGGAVITGYTVTSQLYAVVHGDAVPIIDAGHTGTDPFIVITGLQADTSYSVQVVALTSDGKQHYSPHLFVTTSGFRPQPPSGITAVRSPTSIRLSWNAPQTPDDIPIIGYDVRYRSTEIRWVNGNRHLFPFVEVSTTGAETTLELTDLTPSSGYEIGVRTVVTNSKSVWSWAMYVVTRDTFRMDPPSVSERTSTSLRVSWNVPKDAESLIVTGYKVRYRPAVSGQNTPAPYIEVSTTGKETTIKLTDLTPSTGYEIGLQALGANGNSLWSNPIYNATLSVFPIDAPTGVTTSERTSTSFKVSWNAPEPPDGITITGYEVRYRPAVSGQNAPSPYIEVSPTGAETAIELTNLAPSTSYEIGVKALSAIASSFWSVPVYQTTSPPALVISGADVAMDSVIFNELRNASSDMQDWIELRNVSDVDVNLGGWVLLIAASGSSRTLQFSADTTLPAGEVLLLLNTDPSTPNMPVASTEGASHRYFVDKKLVLPQADFTMILQSLKAWEDVAGNFFFEGKKPSTAPASYRQ